MHIAADLHERHSGVPDALRTLGVEVEDRLLQVGDYVFPGCVIERKSAADLHVSISNGRLWRQVGRLRRTHEWGYLLIEGDSPLDGPVSAEAVRGAILAIAELGIVLVWSRNVADTARWIRRILIRRMTPRIRNRVPYAWRPRRSREIDPAEQALTAARGVSTVTARALLDRFGSLTNVLLATQSDLVAVPGIGEKRARAITALAGSEL